MHIILWASSCPQGRLLLVWENALGKKLEGFFFLLHHEYPRAFHISQINVSICAWFTLQLRRSGALAALFFRLVKKICITDYHFDMSASSLPLLIRSLVIMPSLIIWSWCVRLMVWSTIFTPASPTTPVCSKRGTSVTDNCSQFFLYVSL